jgi:hypothetical protein
MVVSLLAKNQLNVQWEKFKKTTPKNFSRFFIQAGRCGQ